jgi:hypothetical protein
VIASETNHIGSLRKHRANQLAQSPLNVRVATQHEGDLAMSKALILGAAALVFSVASASAADLLAPVNGEAAPAPAPPPQVYTAPPVYAAPLYTAPQVYVVPAPVYTAPLVVYAPPVVSRPIYSYAPGYWARGWHGHWRGWH